MTRAYPDSYTIRVYRTGLGWTWVAYRKYGVDPFSEDVEPFKVEARRAAERACRADAEKEASVETYEYTP